jgi:hypothetical protein
MTRSINMFEAEAMAKATLAKWGDTASCLRISRAFEVPYEVALYLTDFFLRTADLPRDIYDAYNGPQWNDMRQACVDVAARTQYLWALGDAERERHQRAKQKLLKEQDWRKPQP